MKVIKQALVQFHYFQVGRLPRFFSKDEVKHINAHNLDAWWGYSVVPKFVTNGVYLNVDTSTKFIQQSNIHEDIKYYFEEEKGNNPKATLKDC